MKVYKAWTCLGTCGEPEQGSVVPSVGVMTEEVCQVDGVTRNSGMWQRPAAVQCALKNSDKDIDGTISMGD